MRNSLCSAHSPSHHYLVSCYRAGKSCTSLVLLLYSFFSMFPLLMKLVKTIFGKVLHSHIIEVKVIRHLQIDVGQVELRVDLMVDGVLWVLVLVLVYLQGGCSSHGGGGEGPDSLKVLRRRRGMAASAAVMVLLLEMLDSILGLGPGQLGWAPG